MRLSNAGGVSLMRRVWVTMFWLVALAVFVFLGAMNLYWGELNQDEGWYLYAARQVHRGVLPYRDFAFTQGPLLPIVYSRVQELVDRHGVAGGRAVTMVFGLMAALVTSWVAARAARREVRAVAGVLAFIILSCNVYQSYFTTVVKTYSLASLLLMLGFLALSFVRSRGGMSAAFLSGLFFALAAGARLSAGAVLPVAGFYLLISRKELGDSRWVVFGLGGMLGLAGWALPFALLAPDGFRFAMFEYHSARAAGSLLNVLLYKAGFISRWVQSFFVPAALTVAFLLYRCLVAGATDANEERTVPGRFSGVLWLSFLVITAVHFLTPFPYEDYQVFVTPVLAAALAVSLVDVVARWAAARDAASERRLLWLVSVVFLVSTASSLSSPINQGWFARGRDRIWWPLREQSPLQKLREVSAYIAKLNWMDRILLTQDTYIAVEAGLDVPEGMEMGPFCYYPDMDSERARRLHVLNREMLLETLATTDAPIAAFSGYGLAIRGPEVLPLSEEEQALLWLTVDERYEPMCDVEYFGQGDTTLRVLIRKREAGVAGR